MEFIQRVYVVVETGSVLSSGETRLTRMVISDREDINAKKHYRDGHAINAALRRLMKRGNEKGFFLLGAPLIEDSINEIDELMRRDDNGT